MVKMTKKKTEQAAPDMVALEVGLDGDFSLGRVRTITLGQPVVPAPVVVPSEAYRAVSSAAFTFRAAS